MNALNPHHEDRLSPSPKAGRAATIEIDAGPTDKAGLDVTRVGGARAPELSRAALATILVGALLTMVDFFIVNVTLPSMARDLHASSGLLELVIAGYATSYAVLLVIGGRLGDARGRRRLFLIGMAAFIVTSLLCGLAQTAWSLVVFRVLQGAAAALMVPQTLSTIQATGTATSRARAIGWLGATGGLAAVIGQVLGGALVSADIAGTGWRPVFLVNIPIGVVGLWAAARYVPETKAARSARADFLGMALLAATVVAVLLPLTEGRAVGWPTWSWVTLGATPVFALAFAAVELRLERRGGSPLVPPSVVRLKSMQQGLAVLALLYVTFGAFVFVYAVLVQGVLGFTPLRAGLTLSPMALGYLAASMQLARLVARYGRRVVTVGALTQLVGLGLLALAFAWSWPDIASLQLAPGLLVMGLGQGLMMPAATRVVLLGVPVESAGAGSGVLSTTQQVSLAVGVATLGSLFLTLQAPDRLGPLHALDLVIGIQAAVAVLVAAGSRLLPKGI